MTSLSKFKALLVIAVVFLLGAVAGASLGRTVLWSFSTKGPHHHARGSFIEKLQGRLNLSDEQRIGIQAILDEAHQHSAGFTRASSLSLKPFASRCGSEFASN
jgi:uncharacterized membrane protein